MTFDEMIDWVIRTTKRPDKRTNIEDAINAAISFFTLGASFQQDHVEGTVAIVGTDYAQSFSISDTFTRFRRLDYLKRTGAGKVMRPILPKDVYDKNQHEATDRYYRSGDNIVIRVQSLATSLEYGYFQYPLRLAAAADTHWMLDICPDMVHRKACAEVFGDIGEPADSKLYEGKALMLFVVAKTDFETSTTASAE